ncbi:unnamed protein product [Brassicogethes aeneus]|uniref:Uncharacterized protein n=1 Tax=Brassicogethes aeneus TaxID=1431903 RepID=A0A9P0AYW7_BRAAE|nr:unnamed protein product [Brassicogethes aeneus]
MIKEISYLGGKDLKETVKFILKKILSKEVSIQFSDKGKKGKKDFSKLKVCKALKDVIKHKFKETTETDIYASISYVLAGSRDWEEGRKARQSSKLFILLLKLFTEYYY